MYIVRVIALSDILPRMFAVDFELRPGELGTTVIVSAVAPEVAVERAFQLFPEYLREGCRGQVHEVEYAEIEWRTGRAFVIKRQWQKPGRQRATEGCQDPRPGTIEQGQD